MTKRTEFIISSFKEYCYFPGASIETVYESGFSGFVLHRVLELAGIHNIVVNPGSIEVAVHNPRENG